MLFLMVLKRLVPIAAVPIAILTPPVVTYPVWCNTLPTRKKLYWPLEGRKLPSYGIAGQLPAKKLKVDDSKKVAVSH